LRLKAALGNNCEGASITGRTAEADREFALTQSLRQDEK